MRWTGGCRDAALSRPGRNPRAVRLSGSPRVSRGAARSAGKAEAAQADEVVHTGRGAGQTQSLRTSARGELLSEMTESEGKGERASLGPDQEGPAGPPFVCTSAGKCSYLEITQFLRSGP